jgi:hypothetical protein
VFSSTGGQDQQLAIGRGSGAVIMAGRSAAPLAIGASRNARAALLTASA